MKTKNRPAPAVIASSLAEKRESPVENCSGTRDEQIGRMAYFRFIEQGSLPGHALQHWLEAEAQWQEGHQFSQAHGYYRPA
jgi:hypothetical protein